MTQTYQDYRSIVEGLKAEFPRHKSYNLRRGEQGQLVEKIVLKNDLAEDEAKGGYVQCTPSIGFGWSVYQQGNKAVFHYRDGGMGSDTVMLMGQDKAGLETLRKQAIELGIVKVRK